MSRHGAPDGCCVRVSRAPRVRFSRRRPPAPPRSQCGPVGSPARSGLSGMSRGVQGSADRTCADQGLCRPGISPTSRRHLADISPTLCRPGFVPTGTCADQDLCRPGLVPTRTCADQDLCRPGLVPTGTCADRDLCRPGLVPTGTCADRGCADRTCADRCFEGRGISRVEALRGSGGSRACFFPWLLVGLSFYMLVSGCVFGCAQICHG
jgi:hypothetical protein